MTLIRVSFKKLMIKQRRVQSTYVQADLALHSPQNRFMVLKDRIRLTNSLYEVLLVIVAAEFSKG